MVTTVTLNAAVDKLYLVESVALNQVMRVKEVYNTAGGKGLNVARAVALAGEKANALGFAGGFSGEYILSMLRTQGISSQLTPISYETRSCINIRDLSTGRHTEFLEPGAEVTAEECQSFLAAYHQALAQSDVITISGSVPKGTPKDFYNTLITLANEKGKKVILDTSGPLLKQGANAKPTMIKPNTDEVAQLLGIPVPSRDNLADAAWELHNSGIAVVAVSMGKEGVLVACKEGVFIGTTPDIPVVNTVGCGDCMVAGFAVGFSRGYSITETIRYASAVSTANALSMQTGWFTQSDFEKVYPLIDVLQIK